MALVGGLAQKRYRAVFAGLLLITMLGGCWIPEEFDAKVAINGDGSYSYSYDGVLTFAPALADASRGRLGARGEMEVAKLTREMRKTGFQKADYLGSGRFSVYLERDVPKGRPSFFLSKEAKIFYVLPQRDGSLVIGAFRPDVNALRQLNAIGAKIDGTLSVSVASDAKVIRHNAQSEPWLYGLLGSYKWQIKSPDANPFMIVRPGQRE